MPKAHKFSELPLDKSLKMIVRLRRIGMIEVVRPAKYEPVKLQG
jgi:hypothetical protein